MFTRLGDQFALRLLKIASKLAGSPVAGVELRSPPRERATILLRYPPYQQHGVEAIDRLGKDILATTKAKK
jgi:hypothetical protein